MTDLAFGGLEFAFDGPRRITDSVERWRAIDRADSERSLAAADGAAAAAMSPPRVRVDCQLHADASAGAAAATGLRRRGLEWQWGADSCQVSARGVRAEVWRRLGAYAVEATVSADHDALRSLLTGLASAILHDLGGGILHAASIEIDGAVVAFVGPSGAGKTTACGHAEGARLFSVDRLAILPACPGPGEQDSGALGSGAPVGGTRSPRRVSTNVEEVPNAELPISPGSPCPSPAQRGRGEPGTDLGHEALGRAAWLAYPVPGGTLPDFAMPRARARWLPLGAVFRVHQASQGAWLEACSLPSAVAVLRESAFHAGLGPAPELELLARLERLALRLRIAKLHLSLGTTLAPVLRRWLEEQR